MRKFQHERPSDEDGFESKGHHFVAESISDILLNDPEQHIIGLEGELGAGKSTVIELIKQKVVPSNYHVITFDADHYHSALRSSFIRVLNKELFSIVRTEGDRKNLIQATDLALGRTLTYSKEVKSKVSAYVIFFAISLLLMNASIRPTINFFEQFSNPDVYSHWKWIYLALALSPLGLIAIGWFRNRNEFSIGNLLNRNGTDSISETIDTHREVGAIELQKAFKVFSDVVPKDRTLLIVIDNIDRIPAENVKEIWSDLDLLTSLGSTKLKYLLPYSKRHLLGALSGSRDPKLDEAKEYVSKRLPLNFTVPPIVSVGWRNRFRQYWEETLPDLSGEKATEELVDVWNSRVTPRFLKALVNKIGARVDSCPESNEHLDGASCAAYVLLNESLEPSQEKEQVWRSLVSISSEDSSEASYADNVRITQNILLKEVGEVDKWAPQIAAIHYQTTFDIAKSELIIEPIRSALLAMSAKRLIELSSLMGFNLEFPKLAGHHGVTHLAQVFQRALSEDGGKDWVNHWIQELNYWTKKNDSFETLDENYVSAIRDLIAERVDVDLSLCSRSAHTVYKKLSDDVESIVSTKANDILRPELAQDYIDEKVISFYQYNQIAKDDFDLVTNPNVDFYTIALWPNRTILEKWDIERAVEKLNRQELVNKAIERITDYDELSHLLFSVLGHLRIGELEGSTTLLPTLIEEIDGESEELFLCLPFFQEWWEKTEKSKLVSLISQRLFDFNSEPSKQDAMYYGRLVALAIATSIQYSVPLSETITLKNGSYTLSDLIEEGMSNTEDTGVYLCDYLSILKYNVITDFVQKNKDIEPNICNAIRDGLLELIHERRIYRLDTKSFMKTSYDTLSSELSEKDIREVLRWLEGWEKHFIPTSDWSKKLIEDVLTYDVSPYTNYLMKSVDNKHSKSKWQELIDVKPYDFLKTVDYAVSRNWQIKTGLSELSDAIQEVVQTDIVPYDLIYSLCKIMEPFSRKNLMTSMRSLFMKVETSQLLRKNLIRCFREYLSLNKVKSEDVQEEYIAFFSQVTEEDTDILDWISTLETEDKGWNLNEWNAEQLQILDRALESYEHEGIQRMREKIIAYIDHQAD